MTIMSRNPTPPVMAEINTTGISVWSISERVQLINKRSRIFPFFYPFQCLQQYLIHNTQQNLCPLLSTNCIKAVNRIRRENKSTSKLLFRSFKRRGNTRLIFDYSVDQRVLVAHDDHYCKAVKFQNKLFLNSSRRVRRSSVSVRYFLDFQYPDTLPVVAVGVEKGVVGSRQKRTSLSQLVT